jgi:hypothetical protein
MRDPSAVTRATIGAGSSSQAIIVPSRLEDFGGGIANFDANDISGGGFEIGSQPSIQK